VPEHIFGNYAYFSSYSSSWVEHARCFAEMAVQRFGLNEASNVIEVASNDGYLLKHFIAQNIPCLGIEPAANIAELANREGIPTEARFFGMEMARELIRRGMAADLVVANNVLAHVPDLNDFVAGLAYILKPTGVLSVECPHLLKLMQEAQFDTIYHEHYCYFSLLALEKIFAAHGLVIFDAEELPTHGGSLRILAHSMEGEARPQGKRLEKIRRDEQAAKLDYIKSYTGFSARIEHICNGLRDFIDEQHKAGKTIAAYGAAAKGNTLLNVCGMKGEVIRYVVDKNPAKQNLYLPGSRIPICKPEDIFTTKPDYLLIFPWNIAEEVRLEMQGIKAWGGKFVTAIPSIRIF
jgi:SAM-dependent methyltransferase